MTKFWDWVDARYVIRRTMLFYAMFMTYLAFIKGWEFATISKFDGIGTAAIIAAFTAPVAFLQKSAFSEYLSKTEKSE